MNVSSKLFWLADQEDALDLRKLEISNVRKMEILSTKLNLSLTTINEMEAWLQAVFKSRNDHWREWNELANQGLKTGLLDEIAPKEIDLIRNVSYILTKISVDYDKGRFLPTSWFEPTVSVDHFPPVEDVQCALTKIHRLVAFELPQLFITNNFTHFKVVNRNCSFLVWDKERLAENLGHITSPLLVGLNYYSLMFIIDCLRRAHSEATENDCWLIWDESSFRLRSLWGRDEELDEKLDQFSHYLTVQYNTRNSIFEIEKKKESTCNCQMNEFGTVVSNGTEKEIICQECPRGTFNKKLGAKSCSKCPTVLRWYHSSFLWEKCANSTSDEFRTGDDDLDTNFDVDHYFD